jgi:hypothetical protein
MKTFCFPTMIGLFLLNCAVRKQAQPPNLHLDQPQKLKTSEGYQVRSAMTGIQKFDSGMTEKRDSTTNQWSLGAKSEQTYDANGNETLFVAYDWNEIAGRLISAFEMTYYYSGYNFAIVPKIPETQNSVYPNPASGTLFIQGKL